MVLIAGVLVGLAGNLGPGTTLLLGANYLPPNSPLVMFIALAMGLGTFAGLLIAMGWIRHVPWRWVAVLGCVVILVGNVAIKQFMNSAEAIIGLTVAVGFLGQAPALAVAYTIVGQHAHPERSFGLFMALQALLTSGLAGHVPYLAEVVTPAAPMRVGIVLCGLAVMAVLLIPRGGLDHPTPARADRLQVVASVMAVAGLFLMLCGAFGLVTFLGTPAIVCPDCSVPDSARVRAFVSGLANVSSIAGYLVAIIIGARFGRRWPVSAATGVLCVAVLAATLMAVNGILPTPELAAGLAAMALLAANAANPYYMAAAGGTDGTSRAILLVPIVTAISVVVGPVVTMPAARFGLWAIPLAAAGQVAVGLALFALATRKLPGAALAGPVSAT